jgi:hypothetical protein
MGYQGYPAAPPASWARGMEHDDDLGHDGYGIVNGRMSGWEDEETMTITTQ